MVHLSCLGPHWESSGPAGDFGLHFGHGLDAPDAWF